MVVVDYILAALGSDLRGAFVYHIRQIDTLQGCQGHETDKGRQYT